MASRAAGPEGPPGGGATAADDRSTSEVVASLVTNLQGLVKTELELAKLELIGILRDKAVGIALVLAASVVGLFVLAFVGVTGANALMLVVAPWLAWLIVTGVYLLVAVILLLVAVRLLRRPVAPQRTKAELEATVTWAKEQVQR